MKMRFGFLMASLLLLATCSFPLLAGAEDARILFRDKEKLKEGKILAVTVKGLDVFLDEDLKFLAWEKLDEGLRVHLRRNSLARMHPPTVRARFELAEDCRRWGYSGIGRRQLLRLAEERPGLRAVIAIWLRDFVADPASGLLADGLHAFFERRDREAYDKLQGAAAQAPRSLTGDLAKKYLRVLLRTGFRPPPSEPEPALERSLKLRLEDLQKNLTFAKEKLKTARELYAGRRSVTQFRNAFQQAEDALLDTAASCRKLLESGLTGRAEELFRDLERVVARDLLDVHLAAGDVYLKKHLWTDAKKSIKKALALDAENPRVIGIARAYRQVKGPLD